MVVRLLACWGLLLLCVFGEGGGGAANSWMGNYYYDYNWLAAITGCLLAEGTKIAFRCLVSRLLSDSA